MEDVITIATELSTKGFEAGSKALTQAMNNLSRTAQKMGSSFKRIIPTIIGVGSAYQVLSKAINTYMSQNEELSKKMNSIWTALGNVIGPIIERIVDWITTAVSYLLSFLKALGVTSKTASQLSQSAKKNNEELRKTIFGFDELNILQKQQKTNDRTLNDVELPEWVNNIIGFLRNGEWDSAADLLIEKLDELIHRFRDKAQELGESISKTFGDILHAIAMVLDKTDWSAVGQGIARFLNGLFSEVNGEDIGKILVSKITIAFKVLTGFLEDLDYKQLSEILVGMFTGALDSLASAIEGADFQKIGAGIRTFFENIDWEGIKTSLGNFFEEAWRGAIDFLKGIITGESEGGEDIPVVKSLERLGKSINDLAEAAGPKLKEFWEEKILPILEWVGEVALPGILDAISTELERFSQLLNGEMSWDEFTSSMTELEKILTAVGIALGLIKLVQFAADVVKTVQEVKTAITTAIEYAGKIKTVFQEAWTLIAAHPFVILAAAIIAFVALIAIKGDEIQAVLQKVDDYLQGIFTKDWRETFGPVLGAILNGFFGVVKEKWDAIKKILDGFIDFIRGIFTGDWERAFKGLEESITGLFELFGLDFDGMEEILHGIVEFIAGIFTGDWDRALGGLHTAIDALKNVVQEKIDCAKQVFENLATYIGGVFSTDWRDVFGTTLGGILNGFFKEVDRIWGDIKDVFNGVITFVTGAFKGDWEEAFGGLETAVKGLCDLVGLDFDSIEKIFRGIATFVSGIFKGDWDTAFSGIKETISGFETLVSEKIDDVRDIFDSISEFVSGIFTQDWTTVFGTTLGGILNDFFSNVQSFKDDIEGVFDGITDFISDIFSGNWESAWNGVKDIFSGIFDSLEGIVKAPINGIIRIINNFIEKVNDKISAISSLSEYVGISLSTIDPIPELARGGVLKKGQIGFLEGDGAEAVVPLEKNTEWIKKVADQFVSAVKDGDLKLKSETIMLPAMKGISETVDYRTPAIAKGTVLPYGIDGGVESKNTSTEITEILDVLREFTGKIDDIIALLDDFEFVAEFDDIRALAKRIRREIRKEQISEGSW